MFKNIFVHKKVVEVSNKNNYSKVTCRFVDKFLESKQVIKIYMYVAGWSSVILHDNG